MNYTDLVTARVARRVPRSAVGVRIEPDCVMYLHPTKGWRRVSFKRIGIKPVLPKDTRVPA